MSPHSLRTHHTILIADDDEDDRLLIEEALLSTGIDAELHLVEDGEEALLHLQAAETLPSLVVLDLNMPRRNGLEVLQEIRSSAEWRQLPVVILTTSRAQEDLLRSYKLGGNSFVTKPLSFEGLVEIMNSFKTYWFETVTLPKP